MRDRVAPVSRRAVVLQPGHDVPAPGQQIYGHVSSDVNGRFLMFDSHWIWAYEKRHTLPHEALHEYLHRTGMALQMDERQQHNWIYEKVVYCV